MLEASVISKAVTSVECADFSRYGALEGKLSFVVDPQSGFGNSYVHDAETDSPLRCLRSCFSSILR